MVNPHVKGTIWRAKTFSGKRTAQTRFPKLLKVPCLLCVSHIVRHRRRAVTIQTRRHATYPTNRRFFPRGSWESVSSNHIDPADSLIFLVISPQIPNTSSLPSRRFPNSLPGKRL